MTPVIAPIFYVKLMYCKQKDVGGYSNALIASRRTWGFLEGCHGLDTRRWIYNGRWKFLVVRAGLSGGWRCRLGHVQSPPGPFR